MAYLLYFQAFTSSSALPLALHWLRSANAPSPIAAQSIPRSWSTALAAPLPRNQEKGSEMTNGIFALLPGLHFLLSFAARTALAAVRQCPIANRCAIHSQVMVDCARSPAAQKSGKGVRDD